MKLRRWIACYCSLQPSGHTEKEVNTALPNKSICISVGTVVVVPTALSVVRGGLGNGGIVIVEGTLVKGIDDGIETISRICLFSEC